MGKKVIYLLKKLISSKLKARDFEIAATPLCLGTILKDWSVDYTKK